MHTHAHLHTTHPGPSKSPSSPSLLSSKASPEDPVPEMVVATEFPYPIGNKMDLYSWIESSSIEVQVDADGGNNDIVDTIDDDDDDDDKFYKEKLLALHIRIQNGTLAEVDTFPGLWIQQRKHPPTNRNRSRMTSTSTSTSTSTPAAGVDEIMMVGLLEDLQSFLHASSDQIDDKGIIVGNGNGYAGHDVSGGLRYIPSHREWRGLASIHYTLDVNFTAGVERWTSTTSDPTANSMPFRTINEESASSSIIQSITTLRIEPNVEFSIQLHPSTLEIKEDETISFSEYTYQNEHIPIAFTVEGMGMDVHMHTDMYMNGRPDRHGEESQPTTHQNLTCSLHAQHGKVSMTTFTGTPQSIIRNVQNVIYQPPPDYHGVDVMEITCTCSKSKLKMNTMIDQVEGIETSTSTSTSSSSITVYISPVNDVPIIVMPTTVFDLEEDAAMEHDIKLGILTGLYIVDVDVDASMNVNDDVILEDGVLRRPSDSMVAVDLEMSTSTSTSANVGFFHLPPASKLGGLRTMRKRKQQQNDHTASERQRCRRKQRHPYLEAEAGKAKEEDDESSIMMSHLRLVGRLDRVNLALQYVTLSFPLHWHGNGTIRVKCTDHISVRTDESTRLNRNEDANEFMPGHSNLIFGDEDEDNEGWVYASTDFIVTSVNDAPEIIINQDAFSALQVGDDIILNGDVEYIRLMDADSMDTGFNFNQQGVRSDHEMHTFRISLAQVEDVWIGMLELELEVNDALGKSDDISITDLTTNATYRYDHDKIPSLSSKILTTELLMRGHLRSISAILERTKLLLTKGWYGFIPEGVILEITDTYGATAGKIIPIIIKPATDQFARFVITNHSENAANATILSREDESFSLVSRLGLSIELTQKEYFGTLERRENAETFIVDISVIEGTLYLQHFVNGCHIEDGLPYHKHRVKISLYGKIDVLNAALRSLMYTPQRDANTFDHIILELREYYMNHNINDELSIRINLQAVNDPPTIELPLVEIQTAMNGSKTVELRGLEVSDDDPPLSLIKIEFYLHSRSGKLLLPDLPLFLDDKLIILANNPDDTLILQGSRKDLNAAIKYMIIPIKSIFVGKETLKIRVTDGGKSSREDSVDFIIEDTSSLPRIFSQNETIYGVEDMPLFLGDILSWDNGNASDSTIFEMEIFMKQITQSSRKYRFDLMPTDSSPDPLCLGNRISGSFSFTHRSYKTSPVTLWDTSSTMEAALQGLPSISAARVTKIKSDLGIVTGIEVKLLVFAYDPLETRHKDVDLINVIMTNEPGSRCPIEYTVRPESIVESFDHFFRDSKMHGVNNFLFHMNEEANLGGIRFPKYDYRERSSDNIEMSGTATSLQNAIDGLRLVPSSDFCSKAMMMVGIRDAKKTENVFQHQSFPIQFASVDDEPTIVLNGKEVIEGYNSMLELEEDETLSLENLKVEDIDCGDQALDITLHINVGQLCSKQDNMMFINSTSEISSFIEMESGREIFCRVNSENVSFTTNLTYANILLGEFIYKPKTNWWGVDVLRVEVIAQKQRVFENIHLLVKAIEDSPVVRVPSSLPSPIYVFEDSMHVIQGISVHDDDNDRGIPSSADRCIRNKARCYVTVELSVDHGKVRLLHKNIPGVALMEGVNKTKLRGTIDLVNQAIDRFTYKASEDYNGEDKLTIYVIDASGLSTTRILSLYIESINDPPIISTPSHQLYMMEDAEGVLGGNSESCDRNEIQLPLISCEPIVIGDVDDETQTAIIKVSITSMMLNIRMPRIRLRNSTVVLNKTSSWPNEEYYKMIELSGPLQEINWILFGTIVRGDLNYNTMGQAPANISVAVEDEGGARVQMSIDFTIEPVNDNPVLIIEGENLNYNISTLDGLGFERHDVNTIKIKEDYAIKLPSISIRDVDSNGKEEIFLELRLVAKVGQIYVLGQTDAYVPALTVMSTIGNLNALLANMVYSPPLNYFGSDEFEVEVSDLGNYGGSTTKTLKDKAIIPIKIEPQPDIPIIEAPDFLRMEEDSLIELDVSIKHVDSDLSSISVSIHCTCGHVELPLTKNVIMSESGNTGGDAFRIEGGGTVRAWNDVLKMAVYHPSNDSNNAHGKDLETITILVRNKDELDKSAVKSIYVLIDDVPDPPQWMIDESQQHVHILEDNSALMNVSLHDNDSSGDGHESGMYFVRIQASSGTIMMKSYQGLFFRNEQNQVESLLEFDASLASINRALSELSYFPAPNFNGPDEVVLFVDDSIYNSTARIYINVIPQQDTPRVMTSMVIHCEEEEICSLPGIWVDDPDNNALLDLEVSSQVGRLSFRGDVSSVNFLKGNSSGANKFVITGNADDLSDLLAKISYLSLPGSSPSVDSVYFRIYSNIEPVPMGSASEVQVIVGGTSNDHPLIKYDKMLYHDDHECPSSFHEARKAEYASCNGLAKFNQSIFCLEDSQCHIRGFSIKSYSNSSVKVRVNVDNGALYLNSNVVGIDKSSNDIDVPNVLEFRGKPYFVNKALEDLSYIPSTNFVGETELQIFLSSDEEETKLFHSHQIGIDVSNTFDYLKFEWTNVSRSNLHFVDEDRFLPIQGIKLNHVSKKDLGFINLNVSATHGKVRFANKIDLESIILSSTEDNIWWRQGIICAIIDDINILLQDMSFIGDKDWNSIIGGGDYAEVILGVERTSQCGSSHDGGTEDSISIPIIVNSVNDPPQIKVNVSDVNLKSSYGDMVEMEGLELLHIDEGHGLVIPIRLSDIDDDIIKIEIEATGLSQISIIDSQPGFFSDAYFIEGDASGVYHNKIILKGKVDTLNRHLQNLSFKSSGPEECVLSLKVDDTSGGHDSLLLPIHIHPIEREIVLWMISDADMTQPLLTFEEGEKRLLGGDWLLRDDYYMEQAQLPYKNANIETVRSLSGTRIFSLSLYPEESSSLHYSNFGACVEMSVDIGSLSTDDSINHLVTFTSKRQGARIAFFGTIDDIHHTAKTILYTAPIGKAGYNTVSITASRRVCGGNGDYIERHCTCDPETRVIGSMKMFIISLNSPPHIAWIGDKKQKISLKEDIILPISGISIFDEDFSRNSTQRIDANNRVFKPFMTVTISASKGEVSLLQSDGVSFIKYSPREIQFVGPLDNINTVIARLEYQCSSILHNCTAATSESISIHIDDNGFSGKGGALTDDMTMTIEIVEDDEKVLK